MCLKRVYNQLQPHLLVNVSYTGEVGFKIHELVSTIYMYIIFEWAEDASRPGARDENSRAKVFPVVKLLGMRGTLRVMNTHCYIIITFYGFVITVTHMSSEYFLNLRWTMFLSLVAVVLLYLQQCGADVFVI